MAVDAISSGVMRTSLLMRHVIGGRSRGRVSVLTAGERYHALGCNRGDHV